MRSIAIVLECLALVSAAGCGATPEPNVDPWAAGPPAPYAVRIVLPASGGTVPGHGLRLDPVRLDRAIRSEFQRLRVCTRVTVVVESGGEPAPQDPSADLEVRVQSPHVPTFAFAGRTAWFIPNTLLWFFAGFPSFWVSDRAYRVEWDVRFNLRSGASGRELGDRERPLREERTLNVLDRGWTMQVLYTPPGLYEGPDTAQALVARVEEWLVRGLIECVKEESRRSPFEVEISLDSPENLGTVASGRLEARVMLRSPSVLERLQILLDGSAVFERDALTMMKASRTAAGGSKGGRCEYDVLVPIHVLPGEHSLRVFALRTNDPSGSSNAPDGAWSASQSIQFTARTASR